MTTDKTDVLKPRATETATALGCPLLGAGNLPTLSTDNLTQELDQLLDKRPSLLAFDADGTLWSGDVSDDVFLEACREGWLLENACAALRRLAESRALDSSGSTSAIGLRLFEAAQRGLLDECELFAAMTWCYAGRTIQELTEYAGNVLSSKLLSNRLRPELQGVFDWAESRQLRCIVISASPQPIVQWAAAHWGFTSDRVFGTRPMILDGLIVDQLHEPVPFGTHKCKLLKKHAENRRVLAAFGDSNFDFEMLDFAEIAVGVEPKSELRARLLRSSRAVVLKVTISAP